MKFVSGQRRFSRIYAVALQAAALASRSKCQPTRSTRGPLALIAFTADPASPLVAILGLLLLSIIVLAVAGLQVRRMEISYGGE